MFSVLPGMAILDTSVVSLGAHPSSIGLWRYIGTPDL